MQRHPEQMSVKTSDNKREVSEGRPAVCIDI